MIISVKCSHCGMDYETEGEDRSALCPSCGKETWINAPRVVMPPPPAPTWHVNRMKACADCGGQMSKRALWCPACGSVQRSLFGLLWMIATTWAFVWLVIGVIGWLILKLMEMLA